MAERTPLENNETGAKTKACSYFKMKVLKGHDGDDIHTLDKENIDVTSFVLSDKSPSYLKIGDYVETLFEYYPAKRVSSSYSHFKTPLQIPFVKRDRCFSKTYPIECAQRPSVTGFSQRTRKKIIAMLFGRTDSMTLDNEDGIFRTAPKINKVFKHGGDPN